jgi:hypothetical protein
MGSTRDVKLFFFAVANTAFEAFIASWDINEFTTARALRARASGAALLRQQNDHRLPGAREGIWPNPTTQWHPYSQATRRPAVSGFVSGHSTVSSAARKMLELIAGSNPGSARITAAPRACTPNQKATGRARASDRRAGEAARRISENKDVVIALETFTGTADLAGLTRDGRVPH